jgi:error-prone DNA polymerase
MTPGERLESDFAGTGLTTGPHAMALCRPSLPDAWTAAELRTAPHGTHLQAAGMVISRQRPGTAKGFVFLSLEDETGIANAIVSADLFERRRLIITGESALRITGRLQNVEGVIHVKAITIEPLDSPDLPTQASHDFH